MSDVTSHTPYKIYLPSDVAENIARQFMVRQGASEDYAKNNTRSRIAVYHQLKLWQEGGMNP